MKKPALIRSDKPHAVQMSEGSSLAQRKTSSKKSDVSAVQESPEGTQSAPPVKAVKARTSAPTPSAEMDQTPASRPSRRKAKPERKTAARKPRKSAPATVPASVEPTASALPIVPLWEKDSPVKARIQELQALNAQLSEQLQRLPTSRPARGSMP
jgi:hypothetical protein